MKKNLTLLTGILFLVAILVTCAGRNSAGKAGAPDEPKVTIYLKAVKIDEKMHLIMRDSNHPKDTVIDNLITLVHQGESVKWKKDKPPSESGIRHINQIRFLNNEGLMLDSNKDEFANDSIEIVISPNAKPGIRKYVIIFTDTAGDIWCIDPYLKIPRTE